MSLIAWQSALGALVGARTPDRMRLLAGLRGLFSGLEPGERDYLVRLASSRGFAFTAKVQRSWCELRAARAAHFTLALLPPDERRSLLDGWLDRGGGRASFFATEAEAFLEFVAASLPDSSPALGMCRFEQATHRAASASSVFVAPTCELADEALLERGGSAAVVCLDLPCPLVFAPGLPRLWRPCTQDELALWAACAEPTPASELVRAGHARLTLGTLWREGALEVRGRREDCS
jgi:hypothetical protein